MGDVVINDVYLYALYETAFNSIIEYLPEGTKIHAMVGGALAQKIQML